MEEMQKEPALTVSNISRDIIFCKKTKKKEKLTKIPPKTSFISFPTISKNELKKKIQGRTLFGLIHTTPAEKLEDRISPPIEVFKDLSESLNNKGACAGNNINKATSDLGTGVASDNSYETSKKAILHSCSKGNSVERLKKESKLFKKESSFNNGRWQQDEHQRFIEALIKYGNEWKSVQKYVGTRTSTQARSHAQKFFAKINKTNFEKEFNISITNSSSINLLKSIFENLDSEKFNNAFFTLNIAAFDKKRSGGTRKDSDKIKLNGKCVTQEKGNSSPEVEGLKNGGFPDKKRNKVLGGLEKSNQYSEYENCLKPTLLNNNISSNDNFCLNK